MNQVCMISFDVEDYFQVDNLKEVIDRSEWNSRTLRVEENTRRILDILDRYDTKATFFVLGWIAERVPDLVAEIHRAGHEIATHGYGHELVYTLNVNEFREDIRRSKNILEEITGGRVFGYRAPNFSITDQALDVLQDEGFLYDSSLFPAMRHDRYGKLTSVSFDGRIGVEKARDNLYEVLIPTLRICGKEIPWGGGAYFRILPYWIYRAGVNRILTNRDSFVFYFHPWEIDFEQPRVKGIKVNYRIRHYTGQKRAKHKLGRLIGDFEFTRIVDGLKTLGLL